MIRAAIFDIDNTLYSYDDAHAAAWRALLGYAGEALSLAPESFEALHERASRVLEARAGKCAAIHDRLLRYQVMLELLGRHVAPAPKMAAVYWRTFMDNLHAEPGVEDALQALKSMGLLIGIGTNMTAEYQYEKLERLSLMSRVDFIVTSEEVSAEKPDPRFFAACAEKAGCEAGACAFIGDGLKGDVLGALNAGMKALWYRPKPTSVETPSGAYRFASYGELPGIIASI